MAKAVANKGMIVVHQVNNINESSQVNAILEKFYAFINDYRRAPDRLSSFILCLDQEISFKDFEKVFWSFLKKLYVMDRKNYSHDPRVSADENSENFSYSIMEEAFFILALHPQSPRFSRRFLKPAIVFNPHQQFEQLRKDGIFGRLRDIIRKRDKLLQGFINPMLKDFGEKSEVFQYLGKMYKENDTNPLLT